MADTPDFYIKFEGVDGLAGESTDEMHKGEDGWIQIRSFHFGFGFPGKGEDPVSKTPAGGKDQEARLKALEAENKRMQAQLAANKKDDKKGAASWGKSGALDFQRATFSKNADFMSDKLMDLCYSAKPIPNITVEACRYGGASNDLKLPFVRFRFENTYLKSCKLKLATEGLPSEDLEFEYDVVRMESLWTDNATGNRLPSQPIRAGWDLSKQKPA